MKNQDHSVKIEDTWKGMEAIYEKGLAKAIGVSNFNNSQIERIQKVAKIPIHNSQVELHLNFQQNDHVATCKKYGISVSAYAPLGSPGRSNFVLPTGQKLEWPQAEDPFKSENVLKLAEKYKKSPAQILLRHLLQKGILIIPKSTNPKRIKENADIFDFQLTDDEMDKLNKAPQGQRLFLQDFCEGHPEDPFKDERKPK
jgi:diketogulonate reductase-like aldo/keto reductase